jgi:hypothetical protein
MPIHLITSQSLFKVANTNALAFAESEIFDPAEEFPPTICEGAPPAARAMRIDARPVVCEPDESQLFGVPMLEIIRIKRTIGTFHAE